MYGQRGVSTNLARLVWSKWMVGRPSTWLVGHSSHPPEPSRLRSFLVNRRRDVSTKSWAKQTQAPVGWPRSWDGQPAPRSTSPGVWPTWSTCQIHPRGDVHFDIWSTSLYNPLKCSNLVPKFLKSSKH
jgi:hypothetical protein